MSEIIVHVPTQITRGDWDQLHPDYKMIDPDGQPWMLRLTTDCGTTLTRVVIVERQQLFPLGAVVATPTLLEALSRATHDTRTTIEGLLARHARGDWGCLDAEDHQANDGAVAMGNRLLSSYEVGSVRAWIITEADRSSTTVLLPDDY